jgi:hypothetical protein
MRTPSAVLGGIVAILVVLAGPVAAPATELVDANQTLVTATAASTLTFTNGIVTVRCNLTMSLTFLDPGGADADTGLERLGAVSAAQASGCVGATSLTFLGLPTALGGRPANPGSGAPAWSIWVLLPQPIDRSTNLMIRSPQIEVNTGFATCLFGGGTLLANIAVGGRTLTFAGSTVPLVRGIGLCGTARVSGTATTSAALTFTYASMLGGAPDPLMFNGVAATKPATYTNTIGGTQVMTTSPDPGANFNVNNGCGIAVLTLGQSCVVDVTYDGGGASPVATLKFRTAQNTVLDTIRLEG